MKQRWPDIPLVIGSVDEPLLSDPALNLSLYFSGPVTRPPADELLDEGQTYDAANILFDAIEATAVLEEDGTLHIGRQALREAVSATSKYQGVSGSLSCDEFGDCGPAKFRVVRLDDPTAGIERLVDNVVYTYTPGE